MMSFQILQSPIHFFQGDKDRKNKSRRDDAVIHGLRMPDAKLSTPKIITQTQIPDIIRGRFRGHRGQNFKII